MGLPSLEEFTSQPGQQQNVQSKGTAGMCYGSQCSTVSIASGQQKAAQPSTSVPGNLHLESDYKLENPQQAKDQEPAPNS